MTTFGGLTTNYLPDGSKSEDLTLTTPVINGSTTIVGDVDLDGSLVQQPTSNIAVIGSLTYANLLQANSIAVRDSIAYILTGSTRRFEAIDITDKTAPVNLGGVGLTFGDGGASGITIDNQFARVAEGPALVLYNIEDPTNMGLASFDISGSNSSSSVIDGNYMYVADSTNDDLEKYDINCQQAVTEVVKLSSQDGINDVVVVQNLAYIVNSVTGSLSIVSIGIDTTLTVQATTGAVATLAGCKKLFVRGNYAYVACTASTSRFAVVDISDPNSISVVANLLDSVLETPEDVYVSGNYAYVTSSSNARLVVIDISDPTAPNLSTSITHAALSGASQITIQGRYGYIASTGYGLAIVDIEGTELASATIGNLNTDNLTVSGPVYINGSVSLNSGLSVRNGVRISEAGGFYSVCKATVTQTTSRTAVTIDSPSGQVTMATTSLAAGGTETFQVNCEAFVTEHVINCSVTKYSGTVETNGIPVARATGDINGRFWISLTNIHGSNALTGTVVVSYTFQ